MLAVVGGESVERVEVAAFVVYAETIDRSVHE